MSECIIMSKMIPIHSYYLFKLDIQYVALFLCFFIILILIMTIVTFVNTATSVSVVIVVNP